MRARNMQTHHAQKQLGKTIMMYHPQPPNQCQPSKKPHSPNPISSNTRSNLVAKPNNRPNANINTNLTQHNNTSNNNNNPQQHQYTFGTVINNGSGNSINTGNQVCREIIQNYYKLSANIKKQAQNFQKSLNKIGEILLNYYNTLEKKLKQQKQSVLEYVQGFIQDILAQFKQKLSYKNKFAQTKIKSFCQTNDQKQNGKSHTNVNKISIQQHYQQFKQQFSKFSTFDVPIFKIDMENSIQSFQQMLKQFRPKFIDSHMQNSFSEVTKNPHNEQSQKIQTNSANIKKSPYSNLSPSSQSSSDGISESTSTIKKSSCDMVVQAQGYVNKQKNIRKIEYQQTQPICQFSCDQQLKWSPDDLNSNRFDKNNQKKQMVTEIIIQEPSSCEDSILMSEGKQIKQLC